jgi:hypothetical protein
MVDISSVKFQLSFEPTKAPAYAVASVSPFVGREAAKQEAIGAALYQFLDGGE